MRPYSTCLAIIKYRAILTFTGWRCMRPHSTCLAIFGYISVGLVTRVTFILNN